MQEKKDIIYIEEELLVSIVKKIAIISLILIGIALFNFLFAKRLISIANIVLIFSIMLLSMVTFSFSENKFFTLSSICCIVIGVFKIIELIPINKVLNISERNFLELSQIIEVVYVFLTIRYLKSIYSTEKEKKFEKKIDYMILALISVALIFNSQLYGEYNRIYYRAIIIIIFLKTIDCSMKFDFERENKVNYFTVMVISLCISSSFLFIESFFDSDVLLFTFFSEIFCFFSYMIIHLALNYKLLSKPTENLFTGLHNRTEYLMKLNNNIDIKNKNLENIQRKLKSKEEVFKSIYKNIQLPLVIINENRRIIYVNKNFKEIIGIDNGRDIINNNIFKYIDIINLKNIVEKDISKKNIIEDIKIKGENNRIYNVNILKAEKKNMIFIFYDVTDEVNIEKFKKEFDKRMLEEKIKNDFLSNISHDIKTPINVIYSAIQLENVLIKENKLKELKKYNTINKENIVTITRLANNLIDSSKLSNNYLNANMQLTNIVELVEDSCNKLVDYIRNKNLEFYFDTEEEEIYIYCDREFMERIIINIISNSIKYTTAGEITVKIYLKGNKVFIEFKDTGRGISTELLNNVFDKYAVGKEHLRELNKNTGIGLYVVNNLIKLQRGIINLKSKEGAGTTIVLEFFVESINEGLEDDII